MKRRNQHINNKGIALILTLIIIGIIVVLSLQFNTSMMSELYSSTNLDNEISLGSIAESGVEFALALLSADDIKNIDHLMEDWALASEYSKDSDALFEEGSFDVEIIDLCSMIPVNNLITYSGVSMTPKVNQGLMIVLKRLLKYSDPDIEDFEADKIVHTLIDWIDTDQDTYGTSDGITPENWTYQDMVPFPNESVKSLTELLNINGIDEKILFDISPQLTLEDNGGKINVYTANEHVLYALFGIQPDEPEVKLIKDFIEDRTDELYLEDINNDPNWYRIWIPSYYPPPDESADIITTKSSYFQISSIGKKVPAQRGVQGVVKRDSTSSPAKLTMESWEVI